MEKGKTEKERRKWKKRKRMREKKELEGKTAFGSFELIHSEFCFWIFLLFGFNLSHEESGRGRRVGGGTYGNGYKELLVRLGYAACSCNPHTFQMHLKVAIP